MSTRALRAMSARLPSTTRFWDCSQSIHFWLAEMKTWAGAPWAICLARVEEAAKELTTLTPWACSNARPISLTALVVEAAAKTRSSPPARAGPAASSSPRAHAAAVTARNPLNHVALNISGIPFKAKQARRTIGKTIRTLY